MSLLSSRFKAVSTAILHKWSDPEVFTYGDIVIDERHPWWGKLMYVGPSRHAPGGVSVAAYLDQPDVEIGMPGFPIGYIFVIQNEDMRHAL